MKETITERIEYYEKILANHGFHKYLVKGNPNWTIEDRHFATTWIPILVDFVEWIIDDAIKKRIERLYFLSRDGWFPYVIAKKITDRRNINIECRYLRVSRYSLRVPEYHILGDTFIDRICTGGIDVTFNKMMKRAALTDAEIDKVALEIDLSNEDCEKVLSYQEVIAFKDRILKSESFKTFVFKHSKESYNNTIAYLCEEGLLDGTNYALVDSGWIGTLQQSLQNILRQVDSNITLQGYYFGMYEIPAGESSSSFNTFYFSPRKEDKRKVYFSNSLFETVVSEAEGMTMGYNPLPIITADINPNAAKLIRRELVLREYLLNYLEAYNTKTDDSRKIIYLILKKLMGHPHIEEVAMYGDNSFCDDLLDTHRQEAAAVLSNEQIRLQRFLSKALIMTGLKKGVIHESAWIEGSIVRNGNNISSNLRHARAYKRFVYLKKKWTRTTRNNTSLPSKN